MPTTITLADPRSRTSMLRIIANPDNYQIMVGRETCQDSNNPLIPDVRTPTRTMNFVITFDAQGKPVLGCDGPSAAVIAQANAIIMGLLPQIQTACDQLDALGVG